MGMDLIPINPSADAPRHPVEPPDYMRKDAESEAFWEKHMAGQAIPGRYNWSGWSWLCDHLSAWGVPMGEFSGMNDGDPISAETCEKVAQAIEAHLGELDGDHRAWLQPHIALWRTCGGYWQC